MQRHPLALLFVATLGLLAALGCGAAKKEDDDDDDDPFGSGDADTDADADTDSDADSDVDTDTDADVYAHFSGQVTFRSWDGDEVVCDGAADLAGSYRGLCDSCTYTFQLESTFTRDESAPACDNLTAWSFVEGPDADRPVMGFAPSKNGETNVFFSEYYDARYDVATTLIAYDGSPNGTYTKDGDTISWDFSRTTRVSEGSAWYDCSSYIDARETSEAFAGATGEEDLDCEAGFVDVWSFASRDGGGITVDTVSNSTSFAPGFILVDPDGCSSSPTTGGRPCTYENDAIKDYGECPSATYLPDPGTFMVLVYSRGSCNGPTAGYEISVEGGLDLQLEADDAERYIYHDYLIEVEGTGTLLR